MADNNIIDKDLNINPNMLPTWKLWHGTREIIQNALDEKTQFGAEVSVKAQFPTIIIKDTGRGISLAAFQTGGAAGKERIEDETLDKVPICESKLTVRGRYGSGLKGALAVCVRNNIVIMFRTNTYTIEIEKRWDLMDEVKKSWDWNLHALIDTNDKLKPDDKGTEVHLIFTEKENGKLQFDEIINYLDTRFIDVTKGYKDNFTAKCGSIITLNNNYIKGKMFIKDIFLTEVGYNNYNVPSLFSYNFSDTRVIAGEDRDNLNTSLATDAIGHILTQITDKNVMKMLIDLIIKQENNQYMESKSGYNFSPHYMTNTKNLWITAINETLNPFNRYKEIVYTRNSEVYNHVISYLHDYKCVFLPENYNYAFSGLGYKKADDLIKENKYIVKDEVTEIQLKNLYTALKLTIPFFSVMPVTSNVKLPSVDELYTKLINNGIYKYVLSSTLSEESANGFVMKKSLDMIISKGSIKYEEEINNKKIEYDTFEVSSGMYLKGDILYRITNTISVLLHEFGHIISSDHGDLKHAFQDYLTHIPGYLTEYLCVATNTYGANEGIRKYVNEKVLDDTGIESIEGYYTSVFEDEGMKKFISKIEPDFKLPDIKDTEKRIKWRDPNKKEIPLPTPPSPPHGESEVMTLYAILADSLVKNDIIKTNTFSKYITMRDSLEVSKKIYNDVSLLYHGVYEVKIPKDIINLDRTDTYGGISYNIYHAKESTSRFEIKKVYPVDESEVMTLYAVLEDSFVKDDIIKTNTLPKFIKLGDSLEVSKRMYIDISLLDHNVYEVKIPKDIIEFNEINTYDDIFYNEYYTKEETSQFEIKKVYPVDESEMMTLYAIIPRYEIEDITKTKKIYEYIVLRDNLKITKEMNDEYSSSSPLLNYGVYEIKISKDNVTLEGTDTYGEITYSWYYPKESTSQFEIKKVYPVDEEVKEEE